MHLALIVSHAEVINIVPTELSYLRIIVLFEVKMVYGVKKKDFYVVILKKNDVRFHNFSY